MSDDEIFLPFPEEVGWAGVYVDLESKSTMTLE